MLLKIISRDIAFFKSARSLARLNVIDIYVVGSLRREKGVRENKSRYFSQERVDTST